MCIQVAGTKTATEKNESGHSIAYITIFALGDHSVQNAHPDNMSQGTTKPIT